MRKHTFWRVHPTETEISLRIRAVWSVNSLSTLEKKLCVFAIQRAHWKFWSDCVNAQADLNLRWAHMSEGTFSDVSDQMFLNQ